MVDAQALIQAIGKPSGAKTFGDFADSFVKAVLKSGEDIHRIDVVFDRYYQDSVMGGIKQKCPRGTRPVQRVVEGIYVPLPSNWLNFTALPENIFISATNDTSIR